LKVNKRHSIYKLTEQAKRTFLAELKLNSSEEKLADVIKAKNLKAKDMFYVYNLICVLPD